MWFKSVFLVNISIVCVCVHAYVMGAFSGLLRLSYHYIFSVVRSNGNMPGTIHPHKNVILRGICLLISIIYWVRLYANTISLTIFSKFNVLKKKHKTKEIKLATGLFLQLHNENFHIEYCYSSISNAHLL